MPIIEPAIRPPSEAYSVLLQITTSCSANSCTFCGAYKGKPFQIKSQEEIDYDIAGYARNYPDARKLFLMDGDALILNNNKLVPILKKVNQAFPRLTRISSYANGFNITTRSIEELRELEEHKLKLIYIGLESGSQRVLDISNKKATVEEMVQAVKLAEEAKIKSSVIVLLGLGGKEHSKLHVKQTIAALNRMQPKFLSFLTLMVVPGTPLADSVAKGEFIELEPKDYLAESREILKGLDLKHTIFRSNHASNYLNLEGNLPKDKARLIDQLEHAINGINNLKPEFFRGL